MRSNDALMVDRQDVEDIHARILVIQFFGAMDAGASGRLAVAEMLRSLPNERIATFNTDQFIDYRSHRPIATVKDWVTESMHVPELALDRVRDDLGNPILVLHGPEPDAKWETFAALVGQFVEEAGVEITVSFHGVPSGVPHTRSTPVHVHASDASLIPAQPKMATTMQFPAPASSFVQHRLASKGVNGVAFLAAVPFYLMEGNYPKGASALLSALSDFADLSLPVGELEQDAAEDSKTIEQFVESNPEIVHTIASLEEHFDAWSGDGKTAPFSAPGAREVFAEAHKESKDIGDVIEAYLANLSHDEDIEGESTREDTADVDTDSSPEDMPEDPLAAALRRVELRRLDPQAAARLRTPLHRAPEEKEEKVTPEPESNLTVEFGTLEDLEGFTDSEGE